MGGPCILPRAKMTRKKKPTKAERRATVQSLKTEYRRLAMQANRRMTQLEKLSQNPEYKAVLGYAYKNAAYDLKRFELLGLAKGGRFAHDIEKLSADKTDIRELKMLISSARAFLDAPSSTKKGIDKTYNKRAKTLNKKYNTDFTSENMKVFFESALYEKLKNRLGSQQTMIVMARLQKKSGEIIEEIEDARKKHKRITISELQDVDGLNIDDELTINDRKVIENLAKIYERGKK